MAGAERCVCREGPKRVTWTVQRLGEHRHKYFRCGACGREWTRTERVSDLRLPVSADEVVEVHELLESKKLRLDDLLVES